MAGLIDLIREAVLNGQHLFSRHAMRELAADRLLVEDAEAGLLNGEVIRTEPDEPANPGPRYTVEGLATDLRTRITVVCRFVTDQRKTYLLIITCYEIK
jgi:hypothetical protein